MSIPRISICYSTLISLFLVSMLGLLNQSQGQISSGNYNCSVFRQNCVAFNDCPNAAQIVTSGKAKKCGFGVEKSKQVVKICCGVATTISTTTKASVSTTTKANISTTTKASISTGTTIKTPSLVQNTPVIRLTPTPKNATAVAIEKCREYGKYRITKEWIAGQRAGDKGYYRDKQECVNVHTLIVNGVPAQPREYPHMALIGYGKKFSEVQWGCGGSLISERFVLSAAHCGKTADIGPPRWALLGDLTLSKQNDSYPITYSIINTYDHPQYARPSYYHDIALFELNTTVKLSTWIRPACLHTSMTDLAVGLRTSITGWGRTDTIARNPLSDHLLKAAITIVDDKKCRKSYNGVGNTKVINGFDSNTMICAGDLLDGNDTCGGDSGGPLQILIPDTVCMWDLIGVTSFGPSVCGNTEDPGGYTRVAYYLEWIQSIVWP